jgi:4-hydroxy-tetrahydrodipicolinate synthase
MAESIPTCIGVKEASGNLAQITDILAHRPAHFAVYSGDDEMTLPLLALGADGIISVVCNACPHPFTEMVRAGLAGDYAQARDLHFRLLDAMRACFYESNPVPVKAALAHIDAMSPTVRLPLTPLTPATHQRVVDVFERILNPST